ncbi:hypothetical protein K504DRAFT_379033, partial [Pleomassaria siparia CBS 279.74]
TLGIERLDPIVELGTSLCAGALYIACENAFNTTITGDIGAQASWTTGIFTKDLPNDCALMIYFKHTNGSYEHVPTIHNIVLPNSIHGGRTIYGMQKGFKFNDSAKTMLFKLSHRQIYPEMDRMLIKPCEGGILNNHHFPPWPYMHRKTKEAFAESGPCPAWHLVHELWVVCEHLWDTTQSNDTCPNDGSNPLFLAHGDNKSYSTNVDCLFG